MAIDSERQARTIASLTDSPYDVLICSSATEVLLLTGYWPVMGNSIAIAASGGEISVIVPEDEVELAEKTTAAKVISYKPSGLDTLMRPIERLKDALCSVITNLDLTRATIGLQLDPGIQPSSYAVSTQFRSGLVSLLRELVPDATVSACDEWLEVMKAVKTPKELSLMQTASQVAAAGFAKASASIQPGAEKQKWRR